METFPFIQEKYLQVCQALSVPHTPRAGWTPARSCQAPCQAQQRSLGSEANAAPLLAGTWRGAGVSASHSSCSPVGSKGGSLLAWKAQQCCSGMCCLYPRTGYVPGQPGQSK